MQRFRLSTLVLMALLAFASATPVAAQFNFAGTATAHLSSFNEVPAVFSFGSGTLELSVDEDGTTINWDLTYDHLRGNVTQAHIHFADQHVNGAIVVFFCSNLGNGPAGTPACPPPPAHLTGTFTAANIGAGAQNQGITTGQIRAFLRAMHAGMTYANVHTDLFPGGEIRGQLNFTPEP